MSVNHVEEARKRDAQRVQELTERLTKQRKRIAWGEAKHGEDEAELSRQKRHHLRPRPGDQGAAPARSGGRGGAGALGPPDRDAGDRENRELLDTSVRAAQAEVRDRLRTQRKMCSTIRQTTVEQLQVKVDELYKSRREGSGRGSDDLDDDDDCAGGGGTAGRSTERMPRGSAGGLLA